MELNVPRGIRGKFCVSGNGFPGRVDADLLSSFFSFRIVLP